VFWPGKPSEVVPVSTSPSANITVLDIGRKEIKSLTSFKIVDGVKTLELDPSAIPTSCPLLVSTWEETLRMATAPIAIRKVTNDIIFNDYLLKADAIIQMLGSITHTSSSIWGSDAAVVKPQRFLKKDERTKEDETQRELRKLQNQAYFPFGGGRY
jgi:cytochrome P450